MNKELREKTDKELAEMLLEKREALRVFRFDTAGSKTRDVREQRKTRRDVARILTIQREKRSAS